MGLVAYKVVAFRTNRSMPHVRRNLGLDSGHRTGSILDCSLSFGRRLD